MRVYRRQIPEVEQLRIDARRAHARIAELEAQVVGLEAMNTEKAAEIRRLRMGNHPAGRALTPVEDHRRLQVLALAEALTERDAEHEGGAS